MPHFRILRARQNVSFILDNDEYLLTNVRPIVRLMRTIFTIINFLVVSFSLLELYFETLPSFCGASRAKKSFWFINESLSTIYLTLVYLTRWWSYPDRLHFFFKLSSVANLVVLFPFYIEIGSELINREKGKLLFVSQILRLLRIVLVIRYIPGLHLITRVVLETAPILTTSFMVLGILVFFWSTMLYVAERLYSRYDSTSNTWMRERVEGLEQIEEISPFQSVIHTFWWATTTMATVGFGDHVPITYLGKLIASLTMMTGIYIFAIPSAGIGSRFLYLYRNLCDNAEGSVAQLPTDMTLVKLCEEIDDFFLRGDLSKAENHRLHQLLWEKSHFEGMSIIYKSSLMIKDEKQRRRRLLHNLRWSLNHHIIPNVTYDREIPIRS